MSHQRVDFFPIELPAEFPIWFHTEILQEGPYTPAPHVHNAMEIGYCHRGQGLFLIADKILTFHQGDLVVINSEEPHFGHNRKGGESEWTWIYFDPIKLLGRFCENYVLLNTSQLGGIKFNNILSGKDYPILVNQVCEMIMEARKKPDFYKDSIRGHMLIIMAKLHRLPGLSQYDGASIKIDVIARLAPAFQHIHQNYTEKIHLVDLAHLCNMSVSNFRTIFKKSFGKSVYQYLLEYRISMASIELAENNKTVDVIASENGFPTLSCFVRQFKKVKGTTPRGWTKNYIKGL